MYPVSAVIKHKRHSSTFLSISSLQNRAHWKASLRKSGVPMTLCGCNDLGMRLQKLTASFGLLRSELTNSQTGVVKFCFALFRDSGDTIGAISIVWKWWNEMKWCYDKTELELNMYLCGAGIYNIYLSFSKSK